MEMASRVSKGRARKADKVELKPLYNKCEACPSEPDADRASGIVGGPWLDNQGRCTACNGLGLVPTPEGKRILELVRIFRSP